MACTMRGDKVAGRSSSSDGTSTCAVMMKATPALMAAAKRHALDAPDAIRRVLHEGQLEVRIHRRVAVPREVLAARRDAVTLQLVDDRAPRRATMAASCDNARSPMTGFLRVGVDVEHRRVVEREPDRPSSAASAAAKRRASPSSPRRPSTAIGGHSVNGAFRRATRPPSWSTLTHNGTDGTSCCGVVGELGRPAPAPRCSARRG
jgi:hypothetical protein